MSTVDNGVTPISIWKDSKWKSSESKIYLNGEHRGKNFNDLNRLVLVSIHYICLVIKTNHYESKVKSSDSTKYY